MWVTMSATEVAAPDKSGWRRWLKLEARLLHEWQTCTIYKDEHITADIGEVVVKWDGEGGVGRQMSVSDGCLQKLKLFYEQH